MTYDFDWADLAFGSKKPLKELGATFILAPRELSAERFTELVKSLLQTGNILLGLAKEKYVMGFEGQPQFLTLQRSNVEPVIDKVNRSASKHKIYTLSYAQREASYIFEKISFPMVILVNGSWLYSFHTNQLYYQLTSQKTPFAFVSPFVDEAEAKAYAAFRAKDISKQWPLPKPNAKLTEIEMLAAADIAAKYSYENIHQTGAAVGCRLSATSYRLSAIGHNVVVPFETYGLHHGNSRETYMSPPHDLNHYDTVHAEMVILLQALKQKIDLQGTSMFVNLLPCPTCARTLAASDIAEVVYVADHSEGYAVYMLESAGKTVRRLVPELPIN